jgi:hypothetical protein
VIEIMDLLTRRATETSLIMLFASSVAMTKALRPYIWAQSARLDAADTDTIENTFTHHLGAPGQELAARQETLATEI